MLDCEQVGLFQYNVIFFCGDNLFPFAGKISGRQKGTSQTKNL